MKNNTVYIYDKTIFMGDTYTYDNYDIKYNIEFFI